MTLRILKLSLEWFRGSSIEFRFEPNGKNVVIFGPNGSGKSSIVDALEYILTGGTIEHLRGEYSGRRYERSVPNTKRPDGSQSCIKLSMQGGVNASAIIQANNNSTYFGIESISAWSAKRSLIRQERLSAFVSAGKTTKYESVLPLLGLDALEKYAANVRALKNKVISVSQLNKMQGKLEALRQARRTNFPGMSGSQIADIVRALQARYVPEQDFLSSDIKQVTDAIIATIAAEGSKRDKTSNIQILFGQARDSNLQIYLSAAALFAHEAAAESQVLLQHQLNILQSADAYRAALSPDDLSIECPACGRPIPTHDFADHVQREMSRLSSTLNIFKDRSAAIQNIADALKATQRSIRSPKMNEVWLSLTWAPYQKEIRELLGFDPESLIDARQAEALVRLQSIVSVIMPQIEKAANTAAPPTQTLIDDNSKAKAAGDWGQAKPLEKEIASVVSLVSFLEILEDRLRDAIREQAATVLKNISQEVAAMWSILHPEHLIDGIHLYQHAETERAIDIGVRFHGMDQASPTLTLSEGYRNALGLCVLLALAKHSNPAPIILDDIVTSFDREHRASVADLVTRNLAGNQVIMLTHQSDWFSELKLCLSARDWEFKALRPYISPEIGMRWNETHGDFQEARNLLDDNTSLACARARSIMDHQACIIADRLQISLTFIFGPGNDRRTAREIMERVAVEGAKKFRERQTDGSYRSVPNLAEAAKAVSVLLPAFSNTPAHGGYGSRAEGLKLIEAGEKLMLTLKCTDCDSLVTAYSDRHGRKSQCSCGRLQWKS